MLIPQNHPKSQQRVRTCAVIEKPVFRASLAVSMLEIELYQISLSYDRGRSGYEISFQFDVSTFQGLNIRINILAVFSVVDFSPFLYLSWWSLSRPDFLKVGNVQLSIKLQPITLDVQCIYQNPSHAQESGLLEASKVSITAGLK